MEEEGPWGSLEVEGRVLLGGAVDSCQIRNWKAAARKKRLEEGDREGHGPEMGGRATDEEDLETCTCSLSPHNSSI